MYGFISNLIKRTDKAQNKGVCEKVNILLKRSNYSVLDNSKIKKELMEKRILASNFLNAIRN